jgi:hypothetical protein
MANILPTNAFWYKLGNEVVQKLRTLGQKKFKGIKPFGKYKSKKYIQKKGAGKIPRQVSRQTAKVDLTLTGEMWADLQAVVQRGKGVWVGWLQAGENLNKVINNMKLGRIIFNDKEIPKEVETLVDKQVGINLKTNMKRLNKTTRMSFRV